MKKIKNISLFLSILFLSVTNTFSTPLSGSYTIGNGGDYPTITLAVNDAINNGISSPVIFNILSGVYNEHVKIIYPIPGSSLDNTLTIKSNSGNSYDVSLKGFSINSYNIKIMDLSIDSGGVDIHVIGGNYSHNIDIINNNFNNTECVLFVNILGVLSDIYIKGNKNISYMFIYGDTHFGYYIDSVQIINNYINDYYWAFFCKNILVENNIINGNFTNSKCDFCNINKNKIIGSVSTGGYFINNFIFGKIKSLSNIYSKFINNTIIGGSIDTPSVISGDNYNHPFRFINNIVINPSGGAAIDFRYLSESDYNIFYNGGNDGLISYQGFIYNSVQDFYNATGSDQHSNSIPVNFQSPNDLHLAGASIGDTLLKGIYDSLVTDDIDYQLRSLTHPYKGADEPDTPLPVELQSFSSFVSGNNVKLEWVTVSELNNYGFNVERSFENGEWSMISFVKGHGNSAGQQNYYFEDRDLSPGKYYYRLKQTDLNGNFEFHNLSNDVVINSPEKYSLFQNYPNPFNPSTVIRYQLVNDNNVSMLIYDISGREIMKLVDEFKKAGRYSIKFDGSDFPSGVYYYKLESGDYSEVRKMVLVR